MGSESTLAQGWVDDPPPQSRCPYEPGFVEAVIPPPCPPCSVLRSVLRGQATMTSADFCSGLREDYSSPQAVSVARHFPGRGAALPG